jgi:hypothetical protein
MVIVCIIHESYELICFPLSLVDYSIIIMALQAPILQRKCGSSDIVKVWYLLGFSCSISQRQFKKHSPLIISPYFLNTCGKLWQYYLTCIWFFFICGASKLMDVFTNIIHFLQSRFANQIIFGIYSQHIKAKLLIHISIVSCIFNNMVMFPEKLWTHCLTTKEYWNYLTEISRLLIKYDNSDYKIKI